MPDWKPPNSDYKILPIAAYRLSDSKTLAGKAQSSGSDLGGRFELAHFNLFGKNPGLTFEFTGSASKGSLTTSITDNSFTSASNSTINFERAWYEFGFTLYLGSLKYNVKASQGVLRFPDGRIERIQSVELINEAQLNIFSWLQFGIFSEAKQVFREQFDEPIHVEVDNWSYFKFSIFDSIDLALGPGIVIAQESEGEDIVADGETHYTRIDLQALTTSIYRLWGRIKYVHNTTDPDLGRFATMKLPKDELYATPRLVPPEDTLSFTIFLTAPYGPYSFIGPFELGYWMNQVIFNYKKKNSEESHTNRDLGIGVFFGLKLD